MKKQSVAYCTKQKENRATEMNLTHRTLIQW